LNEGEAITPKTDPIAIKKRAADFLELVIGLL